MLAGVNYTHKYSLKNDLQSLIYSLKEQVYVNSLMLLLIYKRLLAFLGFRAAGY